MKTYYKVSLYDDMDIKENRDLLSKEAILSTNFYTEAQLNNKLTRFIEKYKCPFLLTAIQVSEYVYDTDTTESEMVGFVNFSELNERLKRDTIRVGDSVAIKSNAIHQASQKRLNGFIGTVKRVLHDNDIRVALPPFGILPFAKSELVKQ